VSLVLKIVNISKIYRTQQEVETYALCDVSLEIRRREFVSIEGPSGCGKSTLLAIMGLLDAADAGEYYLDGQQMRRLGFSARAKVRNASIGFVFQSFNLIGDLTARENVELPLVYRKLSQSERRRLAEQALERVGMTHRLHHYPAQLSGGQQQRVAIARALVGKPAILLADEPTGNLDSDNGAAVMELLASLHREGSTICVVTHDPRFSQYAERTILLRDGRVVLPGLGASEMTARPSGFA
jgi:putative ABC transport system ATP-binding protein